MLIEVFNTETNSDLDLEVLNKFGIRRYSSLPKVPSVPEVSSSLLSSSSSTSTLPSTNIIPTETEKSTLEMRAASILKKGKPINSNKRKKNVSIEEPVKRPNFIAKKKRGKEKDSSIIPVVNIESLEDANYEIDFIYKHDVVNGVNYYKVHWLGYSINEDSWVKEQSSFKRLIDEYQKRSEISSDEDEETDEEEIAQNPKKQSNNNNNNNNNSKNNKNPKRK